MSWRRTRFILLAVVVAATGLVFLLSGENEPIYKGHRLSWWVDRYGGSILPYDKPGATEALSAIGTNSLPYLINWIRKADERRSPARHCVSSVLKHFPKAVVPSFVARWADENDFSVRVSLRAFSAASTFSVLGRNATSYIPALKAIVLNPTNGYSCVAAASALLRIGPDGFAAVLEVVGTPGLPQRAVLMQGGFLLGHMVANGKPLTGRDDPYFKTNSARAAPILLKCLEDNDPTVRRRAFMLLSHCDPGVMVPALTNYISSSPHSLTRRQATDALAEHVPDARVAVPFLLARYSDSDINISLEASNALMRIAPEVLAKKSPP